VTGAVCFNWMDFGDLKLIFKSKKIHSMFLATKDSKPKVVQSGIWQKLKKKFWGCLNEIKDTFKKYLG
jgi:hypothetical protein